ncbi:DUF6168 family protein [Psychroserpens sp. MEBiC05023]
MTKLVLIYIGLFLAVIFGAYMVHTNVFVDFASSSPIQLEALYGFHTVFTFLLTLSLSLLLFNNKFKDQIGFLYLASMVLKLLLFCIIFKKYIFNDNSFTNIESFNILIPMLLALFFEMLFLSKLLNNFDALKND